MENKSYTLTELKGMLVGEVVCAIAAGGKLYTSTRHGIAPLIELVGGDYDGCIAADRIVGKAAALIYAKLGAKKVYAETLSKAGEQVLIEHGIEYEYTDLVEFIRSKTGGMCPMEQTVLDISDPDEAITALKATIQRLRAARR